MDPKVAAEKAQVGRTCRSTPTEFNKNWRHGFFAAAHIIISSFFFRLCLAMAPYGCGSKPGAPNSGDYVS